MFALTGSRMTSLSVLEGWGYAVGLLRYLVEALLPGIVVIVIGGVIGDAGGPEWLALGVGALGGLLLFSA